MQTTFEEAKKCPRCGQTGDDRKTSFVENRRGKKVEVHEIYCVTVLCRWYNTPWVVQVNEDGTIPEAYKQLGEKQFPTVSAESETRIVESIQAQLDAETRPGGGEIRGQG